MYQLLVILFCAAAMLVWPGRAFCMGQKEVDAFRAGMGYAELSPEQLTRVNEASALFKQWVGGMQVLDIWEELEKELPDNLAVCYELLVFADFEIGRPFNQVNARIMERLKNALERSEKKIAAAVEAKPDSPVPRIVYADMLHRKWRRAYNAESNATTPAAAKPGSPAGSDALLEAVLAAFAEARSRAGEDRDSKAVLYRMTLTAWRYVVERPQTDRFSRAADTLGRLAAELGEESETESVEEKFARLNTEGKAWFAAVRNGAKNEESLRKYGGKALESYRQIARLENVARKPVKTIFGDQLNDVYSPALLDAMCLMELLARAETNPEKRQALIEESLDVFVGRYLEAAPDVQDWHDGGYAVAWHYMSLAELTPFQDKKAAYVALARERLVYNVSFGDEHPGTEFWRGVLEEFDNNTAAILLDSKKSGLP